MKLTHVSKMGTTKLIPFVGSIIIIMALCACRGRIPVKPEPSPGPMSTPQAVVSPNPSIVSQSPSQKPVPPKTMSAQDWEVVKIEKDDYENSKDLRPDRVFLKNGQVLDDMGYEMLYLGKLKHKKLAPTLIFSGISCVACCAARQLYVRSMHTGETTGFIYPGKRFVIYLDDPETAESPLLMQHNTVFFGHCLPEFKNVIIAYSTFRGRHGDMIDRNTVISVDAKGALSERKLEFYEGSIYESREWVSAGKCKEIEPSDFTETVDAGSLAD